MQTVLTKQIKQFEIVIGFDQMVIDPVASAREKKTIFFQPKRGEYAISDKEASYLRNRMHTAPTNTVVSKDGKYINRLELLSDEELTTEKNTLLQLTLQRATQIKAELEIKDDSEALSKSQRWYKEEIARIELNYAKGCCNG